MANRWSCFCDFVFFVIVFGGGLVSGQKLFDGPQILPDNEVIIPASGDYEIFCQANKPIKWTFPEVPEEKKYWTTFKATHEAPLNSSFKYGLKLYIENMTYPFTGYYHCQFEDNTVHDEKTSSKIYLYVDDEEHLSVKDGVVEPVIAIQYHEAVLPCRPTSPDVEVHLETLDEISYTYDPKTGYKFNVTDISQQGYYFCNFERDSHQFDITIFLTVNSIIHSLPKPALIDKSDGHTIIGDALILECRIDMIVQNLYFHWETPLGKVDKLPVSLKNRLHKTSAWKDSDEVMYQQLIINQTQLEDKGRYYCNVSDRQGHMSSSQLDVSIFHASENFIELSEENDVYSISTMAGGEIRWIIDVMSHPLATVTWFNNQNQTVENNTKFNTQFIKNQAILRINDVGIEDFGVYKLIANNNFTEKSLSLFLNVTDKPSAKIESEKFHILNTECSISCTALGYPLPEISWEFQPCLDQNCAFKQLGSGEVEEMEPNRIHSSLKFNGTEPGYVKCIATNELGISVALSEFYITDVEEGFGIFDFEDTVLLEDNRAFVAFNEDISVTCGSSIYEDSTKLEWSFEGSEIIGDNRHFVENYSTNYSNRLHLYIPNASYSDSGEYSCKLLKNNKEYLQKSIIFNISDPTRPVVRNSNMNGNLEIDYPNKLELFCDVIAIPKPNIMWYKDGEIFVPEKSRIVITGDNKKVVFNTTKIQDEGMYQCVSSNKVGRVSKTTFLRVKNKPETVMTAVYITVVFGFLLFLAVIYIAVKVRREKRLQKELKAIGLANFQKGAVENINPELGVDDQAELLPYDKKWEFPIEKLKLGKQLGSGAFGVVMKGEAKNIIQGEEITTVAVKMVKKNADNTYIKALASELKIMVHLGKHLNVDNLLGACTKNVAKRELLVIVEYCRFGNVQNFLLRHRDIYINQVDPKTGTIDFSIGQEYSERSYSLSSDQSGGTPPANMQDYRNNYNCTGASAVTEMTNVTQDEGCVLSNNSIQPEWRSNYRGDYRGNVKPICTKDLLAWAFQVARGMEYLASRKVLHGDLAARNILLTENNVVKICDFGLAKSMYQSDNYKKQGDGPLPVKWMAIESIRDRIFSTQSDVWSFGIVLWEFFSLARTPYPGMEADERLYNNLADGYRMESPEFAPKEVYKMMLDCWQTKPLSRPSFTKLEEKIGFLLEDSVRRHYIDLNDPYLMMNTQRLENGENDYLAMLCPPTFESLSTPQPHYVNGTVLDTSSGYMPMLANTVFSPRIPDGSVFDFNVDKASKEENGHELLPMLQTNPTSDSECESPNHPTVPDSFSNPTYHHPPKIEKKDEQNVTQFVNTKDNYVNMPQYKNIMNQNGPMKKNTGDYVNGNWSSVNA